MENVSLHAPSVPGLGGANLVEMNKNELSETTGGGLFRILDTCCGVFDYWFWDSETGECTNIIGNKCEC